MIATTRHATGVERGALEAHASLGARGRRRIYLLRHGRDVDVHRLIAEPCEAIETGRDLRVLDEARELLANAQ